MERYRLVGAIVSIVAIAATAAPVLLDPVKGDSFPLSTYPMFASRRPLTQSFEYAVGFTAAGERRTIKPRHVANNEIMQARTTFSKARREGRLPQLCERIAGRVGADRALDDVVRIDIVTGTHHAIDYLVHGVRGKERTLTSCAVVP